MKLGSLFSGAGLGDLGWMMAGMEIKWQIEVDEYCRKILDLRFPESKKYGDIKTIKGEELEPVDIVVGGFPCTDISIANNDPDGIAGKQSGLWNEQYRILCYLRPKYAVVENVAALLHRGIERVLGDLSEIGYDAEWQVIPASWHGAFHRRERVWILAYPKSKRWEKIAFQGILDSKKFQTQSGEWKRFLSYTPRTDYSIERWEEIESDVCGDDDGMPEIVDQLKALGNGQIPNTTAFIGQQIMEFERITRQKCRHK